MVEKYKNPASTVDLIVVGSAGIVLIRRRNAPYKGFWALPGGFLDCGRETLEEAAIRELYEETNIKTSLDNIRLVGVYSDPLRDPRGHSISHVYYVEKHFTEDKDIIANDDASEVKMFRFDEAALKMQLAFDHDKILNDFRQRYKVTA